MSEASDGLLHGTAQSDFVLPNTLCLGSKTLLCCRSQTAACKPQGGVSAPGVRSQSVHHLYFTDYTLTVQTDVFPFERCPAIPQAASLHLYFTNRTLTARNSLFPSATGSRCALPIVRGISVAKLFSPNAFCLGARALRF